MSDFRPSAASRFARIASALLLLAAVPAFAQVPVDAFVKKDKFGDIVISPDGTYYAATVPREDGTGLLVIRRSDTTVATALNLGRDVNVNDIWWVNNDRILFNITEQYGTLDTPSPTGELYAVNANGGTIEGLVGWRVLGATTGTRLGAKKEEQVYAWLVDDLPNDDKNVLIAVAPFSAEPFSRAEKMDVYTGKRTFVTKVPVARADFSTDNNGVIRFAQGYGSDNASKLFYRAGEDAEWTMINDENASGLVEVPIGFSADNKLAYLRSEQKQGPDAIVAYDPVAGTRTQVLRDAVVDPAAIVYKAGSGSVPVGARFIDGGVRTEFFDKASPEARLQRSLEAAFKGQAVTITSTTTDGKLVMLGASSAQNPGDFFVFDTVAKKADRVISRREWLNPQAMSEMKPVTLKARDGTDLHGYLTLPFGSDGKNLPAVVVPHGGPFDIYDAPDFDSEVQMLAQAGYAVLQINFRGSGNYGRAFKHAGARQWGKAMQDDITDATKWLSAQGTADPSRICIYGASYGAYAAMVGAAREPTLYKCAAGLVGVYDLDKMTSERGSRSSETWYREWVGEGAALAAVSPVNMASQIKVPVFLSAGGEDTIAPVAHTKKMESALKKAGVPVQALYFPNEGHGYYDVAHRREFYAKLLDFLADNIGGKRAAPPKDQKAP
jgi:dipeptidyl aminopeptidase/acylaminoacyl peptidase